MRSPNKNVLIFLDNAACHPKINENPDFSNEGTNIDFPENVLKGHNE